MTDSTRKTVEPLQRQDIRALKDKGRKAVEKHYNRLEELKVEYVKTDSIYPNSYNPNRQSEEEFELLIASITEDGFTQPVVVQKKSREIVDGEHRWRAASQMGYDEIPVVFVEMTPEQMRIATLRHNRARGSEDIELTIAVLKDLQALGALGHAADSLHMSDRELNALMDDLPAPEANASAEFSSSWVPAPSSFNPSQSLDRNRIEAATVNVQREIKRIDERLETAETEEQYQATAYRVRWSSMVVQYPKEKVEEILGYFGNEFAEGLLRLCRYHLKVQGIAPIEKL